MSMSADVCKQVSYNPLNPIFEPTDRIERIKQEIFSTECSLCLERPALLDKFWHSKQGRSDDHPLVNRAKAIAYVLSNRQPLIYNDELIAGNMTSKRIAANYYPEGSSIDILEDLLRLDNKVVPIRLNSEEKRQLVRLGLSNSTQSLTWKALLRHPSRIRSAFTAVLNPTKYFLTEIAGVSHQVGDYSSIVEYGLQKVELSAASCLQTKRLPDGSPLNKDQTAFYQASIIIVNGIRKMAENLADKAEEMAQNPNISEERKTELLAMAASCRNVPYYPARTFQEGLQASWLMHVALNLEDYEQGLSWGRLDQILYPLYCKDINEGVIDPEKAVELIASFQLKACETIPLFSERVDAFFSGNTVGQAITLGGTDSEGSDVTNELSGLFLDAYAQILTREPNLHVRVHPNTPSWFLEKALEVLQIGNGSPALFGDIAIVKSLQKAGFSEAHARDYAIIGCVEMGSQGRTYNSSDAGLFNVPLLLELALNEGRRFGSKSWGRRIGAKTQPVRDMQSFEDVTTAFRVQADHCISEAVKITGWLEETARKYRTSPVNSIITSGCIERGRDVTWGGADYDFTSFQMVGLADTGDSLYAIKKLVFQDQRYTLEELTEILKKNFAGHESLQVELSTRFPRYGNGISETDRMVQLAADIFSDCVTRHRNTRGGKYLVGIYSMTCNVAFGKVTGALPSGRRTGETLSNGLAPCNGADRKGPTAFLRSAAHLDSSNWGNCVALNLKFDKKSLEGRKGRVTLAALLRSYLVDMGGMQVQLNVVDAETLRRAKADPASYPGLMVRVAGYCAYFRDLAPDVQDEIIARTAHGMN